MLELYRSRYGHHVRINIGRGTVIMLELYRSRYGHHVRII